MNRDKYTLLLNPENTDMDMWQTIYGICGIAEALYDHEDDYSCDESESRLFCALKILTDTLLNAAGNATDEDQRKVRAVLVEPDTQAETLSKKLNQRGLALLEHTAMPGQYAVLEPKQGRLQIQMMPIDGIEHWLGAPENATDEIDPDQCH